MIVKNFTVEIIPHNKEDDILCLRRDSDVKYLPDGLPNSKWKQEIFYFAIDKDSVQITKKECVNEQAKD